MKNFQFIISLILLLIFSQISYSQLDSVYYQGPSSGSVTHGAIQSTDNFGDKFISSLGELKEATLDNYNNLNYDLRFNWDKSLLPDYKYIQDFNDNNNNTDGNQQTVLLNSFPGIAMTNFIPPDPTIAAGPEHIIVCANSTFKIMDKEGNVLKSISAAIWWAPVWPDENGDPQVIYDHFSNRWVMVWMQVNSGLQTAGNLIAYSDDSNPLGTWYMYRLDTKLNGTVQSNSWGDYPKVGYDEEAVYIMTRCIAFSGGFLYNKIRIINKAELYSSNAGPLTYVDIWNIRTPGQGMSGAVLDCITPGISYTPGNGGWFFWAMGIYGGNPVSADFYAMYKIINPLTSPTLRGKVLPVQQYTSPPLANQLGGGMGIETIGWITKGPVIRDGVLHVAHDIQNSTNPNYSSVKYLKVDLNTYSIVDNIEYGSIGYFYLFPAVTVDQDQNVAITFSRSADNEYIGAYYTTKYANQNYFNTSLPIAEGNGNYVLTYGSGINRWGDYFGIYLDPANNYDVWTISEYAAATNIWGTYVGHLRMTPYPGAHAFLTPKAIDFGEIEIGTTSQTMSTILANYGDTDLIISNIPASFGDYYLETNLTFPVTLSSYDSLTLEFTYAPTAVGGTAVLYEITSNDPNFQGISLSGTCYEITQAIEKTFYASSGIQNNGDIITINSVTGSGSTIGPSLFSEVKGLAINPDNGVMYGIASVSGQTQIVRINSEFGDAHELFSISIPSPADLAFDTLGTCYGIGVNGELYTIDLTNGNETFVVDAIGNYSGITFNPITNELWATSRAFILPNKDAVFKVNLSNGDTIIVGHTGLNKITNDLIFDETGNLFGVIGSSSELNDFISIDPITGIGGIIGSVGMKQILSLAYIESVPTSVENDEQKLPEEFILYQNYPNPFNPVTKISYKISSPGFVSLKIFDMLGREVSTLVSEVKQPGFYEIQFDARSLSSGVYYYNLVSGSFIQTKKMMLLK